MGKVTEAPTTSSFTQARMKLKPEFYDYINKELINQYYEIYNEERDLARIYYKGRRMLGLDCSVINLPDTEQTRKKFSIQRNQNVGKQRVQGYGSFLYDLRNELVISVTLEEKKSEEKFLFSYHKAALRKSDIITMDRVYASYRVLSFCINNEIDYIIRFSSSSFKEVNDFWKSSDTDKIVEIKRRESLSGKEELLESVKVRLIKVELSTGETEVLGTSLYDNKEYPSEDFKSLYNERWGIETYFNRIKNLYDVERFSGTSVQSILQDFYGMIFLSNLESLISKEAEDEINKQSTGENYKIEYKVNHSVSYSAMIDYTSELFVDQNRDIDEVLEELKFFVKKNPILKRPNRHFERKEPTANQKLWFLKYEKKINP